MESVNVTPEEIQAALEKKDPSKAAAPSFNAKAKKVLASVKSEVEGSIEKLQSQPETASGILVGALVTVATIVGVLQNTKKGGSSVGLEQAAVVGLGIALAGAGSYFFLKSKKN